MDNTMCKKMAINRHAWLNDLSDEELLALYKLMTQRRTQADSSPAIEEEYQTTDPDYQELYDAVVFVMNQRGLL